MTSPKLDSIDEILVAIQVSLPMNNDGKIIATPEEIKRFVESYMARTQQTLVEKNRSFCGCIMCLHHTEPYGAEQRLRAKEAGL